MINIHEEKAVDLSGLILETDAEGVSWSNICCIGSPTFSIV